MLGATKPESRTCPVVLSERVTASFAGFIGGALCADDVQRGRSPFADRLGDELASPAYVLADDGIDPGGLASAPFDGEGTPAGADAADRGRQAARLSARLLHRAPRRGALDRQRRPRLLPLAALGQPLEPGPRPRASSPSSSCSSGPATASTSPRSRASTPASTRSPAATRSGASGRAIRGGELAEPLREFTIAGDLLGTLAAVQAVGSRPAGCRSAAP